MRNEHWANAIASGKVAGRLAGRRRRQLRRHPVLLHRPVRPRHGVLGLPAADRGRARSSTAATAPTREFIAFWMQGDRVVAGMNVNVWDVNEDVQNLIRSGNAVDRARLTDPVDPALGALSGGAPHRPPGVRLRPAGRRHGGGQPHARLVLRQGRDVRARSRGRGGPGCGGGRRGLGRHRRRPVRSRAGGLRAGGDRSGGAGRRGASPRRRTSSSRSTPTRPRSRARRSPPAHPSSTTPAGCATRRWPASSPPATRRWCSRTASGRRAPRSRPPATTTSWPR